jgi:hypothetical protein
VPDVREEHRRARERDRDRGRELDPLGLARRRDERKERIVRAFVGEGAVVAGVLEPLREGSGFGERGREERAFDLQRDPSTQKLCWSTVPSANVR